MDFGSARAHTKPAPIGLGVARAQNCCGACDKFGACVRPHCSRAERLLHLSWHSDLGPLVHAETLYQEEEGKSKKHKDTLNRSLQSRDPTLAGAEKGPKHNKTTSPQNHIFPNETPRPKL